MKNPHAQFIVGGGHGDDVIADATYVDGASCDREALNNPQSMIAVGGFGITCSAWTDATQTVTLLVETDDNSSFTSATALSTTTHAIAWTGTGRAGGTVTAPVDLTAAERYVRVRIKVTKADTGTFNNSVSCGALFSGLTAAPDPSYSTSMYTYTIT